MEILAFLIAVAGLVTALRALKKISRLEAQIARLAKLTIAQTPQTTVPEPGAVSAKPVESTNWKGERVENPATRPSSAISEPARMPRISPKPSRDMEQAVASRWFVWIGGVALAIGGLLFVKYAHDHSLISPTTRIILGLLLGAACIAGGDRLLRRKLESNYVPPALSAAGLAIIFASIYAAYALYELVPPTTAFVGLGLTGLGALALSLRQGPLIAALGLAGSYLTPTIISSPDPSAWNFFPYLFVILIASFAVLRKRSWWWLGYVSVIASAAWALLWLNGPYEAADTLPIQLFALTLGATAFFAISGLSIFKAENGSLLSPLSMTLPLQIASSGVAAASIVLAAVVFKSEHAPLALGMFLMGMAAVSLISWCKAGTTLAALAASALTFYVLMGWSQASLTTWAMDEQGFWSNVLGGDAPEFLRYALATGAAFTAAGILGVAAKRPPVTWATLASGSAFLYLWGAWARVDDLLLDKWWAMIAAVTALLLLSTIWARRNALADTRQNLSCGLLAIGAAALLVFGEDRMFDNIWLTLAIAILATAYAFLRKAIPLVLLGPTAAALGSFTALRLFVSREIWTDNIALPLGKHWPIYGYGVPAFLFYMASRSLKSSGDTRSATAFEALTLGLAISLVSLELRVLIAGGIGSDSLSLLEMSAHILTWLGASYGLIYRQKIFSSFVSLWGARILLSMAIGAILILSLGLLNPVFTEEPFPGNLAFNTLLLAYAAPAILLALISRNLQSLNWGKLKLPFGIAALVLALTYITLETKRVFQGPAMVAWSLSIAESYAYSVVWLASGLALFLAGIKLGHQHLRYAGLAVLALVVCKVFLWDMAELDGIYRILSFMGLGLCLIGMGWVYTRFVQSAAKA